MIADDLDKKIKNYQAKVIRETNSSFSYSKAVNELLKKSL
jgi:hypothetical protein